MAGETVTWVSAYDDSAPSLAVRRRMYTPAVEKLAVVTAALGLAKVTVPGPEVLVHAIVNTGGVGRPSSVTVPFSAALAGRVTVKFGPALTTGAWLPAATVT